MKDYKDILNKYKELFCDYFNKEIGFRAPIKYGICCEIGWYDLIDKLCEDIMSICIQDNIPVPAVSQVKEKFGMLCFYIDVPDNNYSLYHNVIDRIVKAQRDSYNICEICGSTEDIGITTSWLQIVCKKCYDAAVKDSPLINRQWVPKAEYMEFVKRFRPSNTQQD